MKTINFKKIHKQYISKNIKFKDKNPSNSSIIFNMMFGDDAVVTEVEKTVDAIANRLIRIRLTFENFDSVVDKIISERIYSYG